MIGHKAELIHVVQIAGYRYLVIEKAPQYVPILGEQKINQGFSVLKGTRHICILSNFFLKVHSPIIKLDENSNFTIFVLKLVTTFEILDILPIRGIYHESKFHKG